ncbi:serine/threonine-protein kinase [Streptomyces sp. MAR4 CNX-425]|uniref:serine/threonine-protein kinase n=1 Tax=Streptomyces sp. MAR4 CNX-425 TaxID=3406343 RepID=UPI003B51259E
MDVGGLDRILRPLGPEDPATVAAYRLAGRLGAGGMGKVYLSYTPGGRPVAIKVIRPEFADDPEFRRRFAQEVHAAQRVQGLYTAPVVDFDTEGEQPWLATAYVTGPALADVVSEERPLPLESALLLIAGVAEALTAIHGAGVVHRDLKPSNVLLAADGPRVIDFGIARAADATALTGSGLLIGTPAFMSPEQAAGRKLTPATDVFALGQVAVFATTGRPAHGEGPSHAVVYRIVHEEPDLTGVPDALRPVVDLCLAKDPAERGALTEVIRACEAAGSQTQLRIGEGWLPGPVAAAITERTRRISAPPPPAAAPPPATAPAPPVTAPAPGTPPAPAAPRRRPPPPRRRRRRLPDPGGPGGPARAEHVTGTGHAGRAADAARRCAGGGRQPAVAARRPTGVGRVACGGRVAGARGVAGVRPAGADRRLIRTA